MLLLTRKTNSISIYLRICQYVFTFLFQIYEGLLDVVRVEEEIPERWVFFVCIFYPACTYAGFEPCLDICAWLSYTKKIKR